MTQSKRDYTKLKYLLETQEKFPLEFMVKFIGKNSLQFQAGIDELERNFPGLRIQSRRESSAGNHLAMTYMVTAQNANEILIILESISDIKDVQVIL